MNLLDQWNDNLEPEQKTKVLRENFLTLDKAIQSMGLYLLRGVTSRAAQNVTSTIDVDLTAFLAGITTSGGLVQVNCNLFIAANGITTYYSLYVDGNLQLTHAVDSADSVGVNVPLVWMGNLAAGAHTFKLRARVSGGTGVIGNSAIDSVMYVLEYMKG